jgi:ketosteroid isomerase-like protein
MFALLAFAAGFAVRPFGALVFYRLGDLVGRKRTLGWRHFASCAVVVFGFTSAVAAENDIAAILALRADSNEGLLAHDVDRVLRHTTDNFILVGDVSGGHIGRSVVHDYFLKGFAEPGFVTYIRTPDEVAVSDAGDRASERGKWQGVWRSSKGGSLMSGEYSAHWVKKDGAWVTLAEVYVTLHCSGPICAP